MLNFREYLLSCADGHCIYVLGAQGKVLTDMTDEERRAWITKREGGNDVYIQMDENAYNLKRTQGFDMIEAYDCSGLIMHYLQDMAHEFDYDTTAQGLYNLCEYHPSMNEIQAYDLVFMGDDDRHIKHVGVYIGDGKVVESRRIGFGVQLTDFNARPWKFCGHLKQLEKYLPAANHPKLGITKPLLKGDYIKQLQQLLNDYGFECGAVDGKYGKKTDAALHAFCAYYCIGE